MPLHVIGEFAGELFLNGFFLVSTIALAQGRKRWLLMAGVVASVLGWFAMLRNLTAVVAPVPGGQQPRLAGLDAGARGGAGKNAPTAVKPFFAPRLPECLSNSAGWR